MPNQFTFSRLSSYGKKEPTYVVLLNNVSLGTIEATTAPRYPGRSKAQYRAFPDLTQGNAGLKGIGVAGSRQAAAELIVSYLQKFKHGQRTLAKAAK